MKGILIDPTKRELRYIEFGLKRRSIASIIECQAIDVIALEHTYKDNQKGFENDLWIDDEYLLSLHDGCTGFIVDCFPQPIFGYGLILGIDLKSGESRSTTLKIEQLTSHITFCIFKNKEN